MIEHFSIFPHELFNVTLLTSRRLTAAVGEGPPARGKLKVLSEVGSKMYFLLLNYEFVYGSCRYHHEGTILRGCDIHCSFMAGARVTAAEVCVYIGYIKL